jgi:hypothetical protein
MPALDLKPLHNKGNADIATIDLIGECQQKACGANIITFTKFSSSDTLSKIYHLEDQKLVKLPAAQMTSGYAERVSLPFKDFPEAISQATENQAFGYGQYALEHADTVRIVTKAAERSSSDAIARAKANFIYLKGAGGVLMLDHDPSEYGPDMSAIELLELLIKIHPKLGEAAHIVRGSVSAGVHLEGSNVAESLGFHIYMPVLNAADIPRYGELLFKRLWLAGHGYIALSGNGSALIRTAIDSAVFSPERLDFVAPPVIQGTGVKWTPPSIVFHDGESLDTETLLDLNADEETQLEKLIAKAKHSIKKASDLKQAEWGESKINELQQSGVSIDEARKTVELIVSRGSKDLYGDYLLYFAHLQEPVSVFDVLDNPDLFDDKSLADPIEGIGYGSGSAKFYWNDGDRPCINSFAHGGQRYFLHKNTIANLKSSSYYRYSDASKIDRDKNGLITAIVGNVCTALDDPDFLGYHVGFDEFRAEIMFHYGDRQWRLFSDEHYTQLRLMLEAQGFKAVSKELIRDAVHYVAIQNKFDSAQVWLNELIWDETPRIANFYIACFGAVDTPYVKALGLYTWTAMAGRVLDPGCQADMVPILFGEQGIGKSTGIAAMAPSMDYFVEINFADKDDDNSRKMRGTLVAELSELRGLHTKDLESIKSFITRRHEKWIPKFKEFKATFPRRLVFIGTTNQEKFLSDATGNRRFLPVEVTKVEREKITSERSQYWAEAAYLFKKTGIAWEDAEKLAVEQFERFEMTNPWQDLIEHWLKSSVIVNDVMTSNGKAENITTRIILDDCLGIQKKDQWHNDCKKVAEIMRKLGYESKQLRRNGVKSYFWVIKES